MIFVHILRNIYIIGTKINKKKKKKKRKENNIKETIFFFFFVLIFTFIIVKLQYNFMFENLIV